MVWLTWVPLDSEVTQNILLHQIHLFNHDVHRIWKISIFINPTKLTWRGFELQTQNIWRKKIHVKTCKIDVLAWNWWLNIFFQMWWKSWLPRWIWWSRMFCATSERKDTQVSQTILKISEINWPLPFTKYQN